MIRFILIIVAVIVGILLLLAALRPNRFRIERSKLIAAPPERIWSLLEDFRNWSLWSPWEKLDPNLKREHGGAARGHGATYAWEGNKKVGAGRMEIVETTPPDELHIKLDFFRPFEAHNMAEFKLTPEAGGTRVAWAMHGPQPFIAKLMGLLFNFDKMVGRDFEKGLAALKTQAEGALLSAPSQSADHAARGPNH
jgi:uncharacterized protein YndB with AHSA1/START domain